MAPVVPMDVALRHEEADEPLLVLGRQGVSIDGLHKQLIHLGAARVTCRDTKTGRTQTLTADYVVICLPMSILAGLDCQLSPETMAAVRSTRHSNSAKMGRAMKRRFWEEDDQIFGGHLYSNLRIGEFSYPSTGYFPARVCCWACTRTAVRQATWSTGLSPRASTTCWMRG